MTAVLAGLAAAALVGVVVSQCDLGERQASVPAAGRQPAPATTVANKPFFWTELFPLIEEADVPIPLVDGISGSVGEHDQSDTRSQAFIAGPSDAPTDVIAITAFPAGEFQPEPFPESVIGRRTDVHEPRWNDDGGTTLQWGEPAMQFAMAGRNLDLMYALLELVVPVYAGEARFGFNGPLPGGLRPVGEQLPAKAGATPYISAGDGEISVEIFDGDPFTLTAGQKLTRTSVDGRPAWLYHEPGRAPTLAVEVGPRETRMIYGHTLTLDQLLAMAAKVQLVDEATWRAHYGVADNFAGSDSGSNVATTAAARARSEPVSDSTVGKTVQPAG